MTPVGSVFLEYIIALVLYAAGVSLIEYFLARLESPWPGRVLMFLTLTVSVIFAVIALYYAQATLGGLFLILVGTLLALNIPTLAAFLVYRRGRRRLDEKKDVDKMNIQDL